MGLSSQLTRQDDFLLANDDFRQMDAEAARQMDLLESRDGLVRLGEHSPAVRVDPSSALMVLKNGMVEVDHAGHRDQVLHGPWIIGLFEQACRYPGQVSVKALEPTEYLLVDRTEMDRLFQEIPWFHKYRQSLYEFELARLYSEQESHQNHLKDFFLKPYAGMVPGPYEARQVSMFIFVMEEDPAILESLLPPRVYPIWGLRNRYLLVFTSFQDFTSSHHHLGPDEKPRFQYQETAIFIPCRNKNMRPGAFCPMLFPDSYLAIAIGREMYGFPKRFGRTILSPDTGSVDLVVNERTEMRAGWKSQEPLSADIYMDSFVEALTGSNPIPDFLSDLAGRIYARTQEEGLQELWPRLDVFVRQQIPAWGRLKDRKIRYRTDQLLRIPFEVQRPRRFSRLVAPWIDFPLLEDPEASASLPIVSRKVIGGFAMDLGLFLAEADVIHHYDWTANWFRYHLRKILTRLDRGAQIGRRLMDLRKT